MPKFIALQPSFDCAHSTWQRDSADPAAPARLPRLGLGPEAASSPAPVANRERGTAMSLRAVLRELESERILKRVARGKKRHFVSDVEGRCVLQEAVDVPPVLLRI